MKLSLTDNVLDEIFARLGQANSAFNFSYPGELPARQPVHTVYGGAHLFKADTANKLGGLALKTFEEFAPNFVVLANILNLPGCEKLPEEEEKIKSLAEALSLNANKVCEYNYPAWLAHTIYIRVNDKLKKEPVEDFRIDFEDGYGIRSDAEEDGHAIQAAGEVAKGYKQRSLPPFIGIRIKPLTEEFKRRSGRTLDIFLTKLLDETEGKLPTNFVVTLPKVVIPEQVVVLGELLRILEARLGLSSESLKLEVMVEATQTILNNQGQFNLPLIVEAAEGRCRGVHFGVYDYTASCNITSTHQSMEHPACDFARQMIKLSLSGTGVWLADGATNVLPVGPQETVRRAWRRSYDHIQHSLEQGYYQGWDLHPAQLPIRYAACYAFFLTGLKEASARLAAFMAKAAQATLHGDVFDDAATGQGLLNYFLRALNCGAVTSDEIMATGLTLEQIKSRSFAQILESSRQ